QPDRLPLDPFAPEPAALREALESLVVRMRAHLDPSDAFGEQPVAQQAHGTRHQAAPAPRFAREIGELVVVARTPGRDHRAERLVARLLGDAVVVAVAAREAV